MKVMSKRRIAMVLMVAGLAIPLGTPQSHETYAFFKDTGNSGGNVLAMGLWTPCDDPGPDAFGYTCHVIGHAFDDISATGTALNLGDDQVSSATAIGFTFKFYGINRTLLRVSSNGFLSFNGTTPGCCTGVAIPNATLPNNLVAGYWEDLLPPAGSIRYQVKGTAPTRNFTLQYTNVGHHGNASAKATFQMKLFEGSNKIHIAYMNVTSDGGNHSAGIENMTGLTGLRLRFGNWGYENTSFEFSPPVASVTPIEGGAGASAGTQGHPEGFVTPEEWAQAIAQEQANLAAAGKSGRSGGQGDLTTRKDPGPDCERC